VVADEKKPHRGIPVNKDRLAVMAPWSGRVVEALRERQADPTKHPYTCAYHSDVPLEPTIYGWECRQPGCYYTQQWAHAEDTGVRA
jgi:hypothetical protein